MNLVTFAEYLLKVDIFINVLVMMHYLLIIFLNLKCVILLELKLREI